LILIECPFFVHIVNIYHYNVIVIALLLAIFHCGLSIIIVKNRYQFKENSFYLLKNRQNITRLVVIGLHSDVNQKDGGGLIRAGTYSK